MKSRIKCPECGKITTYTPDNLFRPFCSERCRLIDLGEWIEERYKVNLENSDETQEFLSEDTITKH